MDEKPDWLSQLRQYGPFRRMGLFFYLPFGGLLGLAVGDVLFASPTTGLLVGAVAGLMFHRFLAGPLDARLRSPPQPDSGGAPGDSERAQRRP